MESLRPPLGPFSASFLEAFLFFVFTIDSLSFLFLFLFDLSDIIFDLLDFRFDLVELLLSFWSFHLLFLRLIISDLYYF